MLTMLPDCNPAFTSDVNKDLTCKAKAKDTKIVLKDSLRTRPRTNITGFHMLLLC